MALEENGCFEVSFSSFAKLYWKKWWYFVILQNLKTKNNLLQELAKDSDGLLLLSLIREFLDYYGLSFTASVFDPELASYGIECDCKDYMKLGNQLKLTSDYSNSNARLNFWISWPKYRADNRVYFCVNCSEERTTFVWNDAGYS